jgi:DNA modification methylase
VLIHGDCVEVMAGMDPESVDAIVCDPPYGLEFMGKEWDRLGGHGQVKHTGPADVAGGERGQYGKVSYFGSANRKCRTCNHWEWSGTPCKCETPDFPNRNHRQGELMQQWHQQWAEAAYRVAKPSAYLLAFGGTRTVHRMTVALEDAGWIIRDMLVWGYASGFPKSKASLKPAWEPIVMARKPGPLRMLAIDECRIGVEGGHAGAGPGPSLGILGDGLNGERAQPVDGLGRWPANIVLTDPIFDGGVEGVVGGGEASSSPSGVQQYRRAGTSGWAERQGVFTEGREWSAEGYGDSGTYSRFFLVPKSSRSDREPVDPSYSYRLHRERGECSKLSAWDSEDQRLAERMDSTSPARAISEATWTDDSSSDTSQPGKPSTVPSPKASRSTTSTATSRTTPSTTSSSSTPSPTSASTPGASSETESGGSPAVSAENSSLWGSPTGISVVKGGRSTDDAGPVTSGSSSSRNACARCGRPLPRFSTHPTQKPTELMRHLVRLVTPTGGVVLDPFLGSGTTALAAEMEGFEWIGIEREAEYVAIAEARLNGTQRGLGLAAS